MKTKQPKLKIGDLVKIIKTQDVGTISKIDFTTDWSFTVDIIEGENYRGIYRLDQLQLITPKKEVKKWNYSREEIKEKQMNMEYDGWIEYKPYYFVSKVRDLLDNLLAKQSTPKKKSKEIKEIDFENVELMEFKEFYKMLEIPKNCEASNRSEAILIMFRNQCKLIRNQKKIQDTINLLIKNK